ncbi:MAG: phosphoribosylamine--glycine ligase [Succinivibrio sp.]|nr:phosphoribosylamine--glycine ligase [Succinivibrio sp.]
MQVLVLGSGGREHALAWRVAQSPEVEQVFVAPGNPGTAKEAKMQNVPLKLGDHQGIIDFAKKNHIALTIVGPEAPLVEGICDKFDKAGLKIFGPSAQCARLEGSKSFTKDFLKRHHIPTAAYEVFSDEQTALDYVNSHGAPVVIKADGLAAGKGVTVAMTLTEAREAVKAMLGGRKFGEASSRVVIEDFMDGEEASFIVMCDGENALPMPTSQDHKRVGDGDTGPNTGGMGAYSPAPVVTPGVYEKVMERIIKPTLQGLKDEGTPYHGFLYAGLMIDKEGNPRVVEFNCRFGDPETQPIMLRLKSDLASLCLKGCEPGGLKGLEVEIDPQPAVGVVLAAAGYPENPQKGAVIKLPSSLPDGVKIFEAGTGVNDQGLLEVSGGRVLCVTARGADIKAARDAAYAVCGQVECPALFYRRDIAWRALARL